MPGKILRRCTLCKKFHASYLVDDPELGKCYLCYTCWKATSLATSELQVDKVKAYTTGKEAYQSLEDGEKS